MAIYPIKGLIALLLLLLPSATGQSTNPTKEENCPSQSNTCTNPDYLIIGAGGSGIQTALFLKAYNHSFRIFEKSSTAAAFWTHYPVFNELISVNKRVRNETQRFRYDWHSFLECDLGMYNVSEAYYPTGGEWHEYMNRVVEEAGIEVEYNTEVSNIANDGPCVTLTDGTTVCAKYRVFVGTGLQEKDERYLRAIGGTRYSSMNLDLARQKRVCILGNGNAGFEVAQNIFTVADRVIVIGKRATRLSAVTKYTGDVRLKFLTTLENFHGKLLDTVLHDDLEKSLMNNLRGFGMQELNRDQVKEMSNLLIAGSHASQYQCELLVLATGFRSIVPGKRLKNRFPSYGDLYADSENPSINYIGWHMHRNDFQRGAGGFLSGYRYLIRNLIRHVREIDHGVEYPYLVFNKQEALDYAVKRFQVADDLVILQDGVVIRDAIVPSNGEYRYYEGITYNFFKDFEHREDIIYLYFAWGDGRTAATVFDNVYMYNDTQDLRNIYLHPLVEVNGLVREGMEDIEMAWKTARFIPPIKRIVRDALRGDLSKFYPKPMYSYQKFETNTPKNHTPFEEGSMYTKLDIARFSSVAAQAILAGGTKNALQALHAEAKRMMPDLYFPQPEENRVESKWGF